MLVLCTNLIKLESSNLGQNERFCLNVQNTREKNNVNAKNQWEKLLFCNGEENCQIWDKTSNLVSTYIKYKENI